MVGGELPPDVVRDPDADELADVVDLHGPIEPPSDANRQAREEAKHRHPASHLWSDHDNPKSGDPEKG